MFRKGKIGYILRIWLVRGGDWHRVDDGQPPAVSTTCLVRTVLRCSTFCFDPDVGIGGMEDVCIGMYREKLGCHLELQSHTFSKSRFA